MKKSVNSIAITTVVMIVIAGYILKNRYDTMHEYAYLAPYVKVDMQWGEDEYNAFLEATTDKHLIEIAVASKVSGLAETDLKDVSSAVSRLGGRNKVVEAVKKDILWDSSYVITYLFKDDEVLYHKIVSWVAKKNGVINNGYALSSYETEKKVISAIFVETWDKMNEEERNKVIKESELNRLTSEQKAAIVAGSGAAALSIISATVLVSGFSFYTTMTSVMAASAGVFGITLPFAAYSGATTTVGVLSGPIGWTVIGITALSASVIATGPNHNKTTEDIIAMHVIKAKALMQAGLLQ